MLVPREHAPRFEACLARRLALAVALTENSTVSLAPPTSEDRLDA